LLPLHHENPGNGAGAALPVARFDILDPANLHFAIMREGGLAKPDGTWLDLFHANIHWYLVTWTLKQNAHFEGHWLASLLYKAPPKLPPDSVAQGR
jgi:hypothetical protein